LPLGAIRRHPTVLIVEASAVCLIHGDTEWRTLAGWRGGVTHPADSREN